jgi:putative nucleotidyltransferase with HDIG domain
MAATVLITARATSATVADFEGNLLRSSLLSNDHLAVLEAERLAQLRAAIDTQGVSAAVSSHDGATLSRLLRPIQANALPAQLTIRVLDARGDEVLTLTPNGDQTGLRLLAGEPIVAQVLAGQTDAKGDKNVFARMEPSGMMLYWIGPVHADAVTVGGAILVGQPLAEVAGSIRDSRASELIFYDQSGQVLLSSLPGVSPLSRSVLTDLRARPVRIGQTINGHPWELLVGNWRLRADSIGYLASAIDAEPLNTSIAQIRALMVAMFGVAALMTLIFGGLLARRITRPVEKLVASTAIVAGGNLSHRAEIASNDEIGMLAQSFNAMAGSLEQKSKELEENYFASIESLARAIDARDPYTFGHSTRVAAISLDIAQAMGLPPNELNALRRAALLHDIGKIGVEDRILRKPGPLTDEEWDAMKQHPLIGYRMLSGLTFLKPSLNGVLHHHERWDGRGYPAGLKEGGIERYVRIMTLADTLDAMTSDRPYRLGLPFERALGEIRRYAGTQFDPNVVEAFLWRSSEISVLLMDKTVSHPSQVDVEWLKKVA